VWLALGLSALTLGLRRGRADAGQPPTASDGSVPDGRPGDQSAFMLAVLPDTQN
jgi:hypothetical protein